MYLAILSGILLALAYPIFNLEFLAFVAFVPLFFVLEDKSLKQAFLLAFIAGIVFWAITIYWLIHVTLIGLILLVLYLALYFGLFGLFFKLVTGKLANWQTLIIPAVWVLLELLRSRLITGFPWALLGYSQYLNLPFIQIADIAGVWGVSFLVMLINVAIYSAVSHQPSAVSRMKIFLVVILVLGSVLSYGFYKLNCVLRPSLLVPLKISVIQGNIPQYQKWNENFRSLIWERYETLTKKAAKDKPDLIIWPETSVPGVIGEEPGLLTRISRLAEAVKTPILIGAVTSRSINYYNSAILISAEGKILQQYDKLHLVPFGEYVPLERHFTFLRDLIGVPIGDFTAGREDTVFKLPAVSSQPSAKFAVLICFEDIIPVLSRRFVKGGAQFLVNITNDAWFMKSSAPYQHAQVSVFRAIENRAPVVRAANTGVSCFIDRYGRIYDKVSDGKKDIFVVGYKTGEINRCLKETGAK